MLRTKLLLCIALLLLAAPLSESSCTFQRQDTSGKDVCVDVNDGTFHELEEVWMGSNCWECVCSRKGYTCCDRYFMPNDFPDDCMITFDIQECSFHVKQKAHPTVDCQTRVAVGK
ncbi:prostate-associated microseminoprotein-like isoform X2 [Leucoraja erinacea]|uniref:prostate-associated microseminoprotein-like isoform X2 n=1 Tax=Leucoraja erinaceus TaxID=7782 RepID=UPI0024589D8A|nr:prostate-associated microseminoprotein-like isoform X2 [Leucoraja erinacea]